jgi:hypothetical protein
VDFEAVVVHGHADQFANFWLILDDENDLFHDCVAAAADNDESEVNLQSRSSKMSWTRGAEMKKRKICISLAASHGISR